LKGGVADYLLDGLQLPNYCLVSLKDFAKNWPCLLHVTCSMTIQDFRVATDYLGEFEHIVVLALMRLGDRAYGVTVRQEIAARIGRDVSVGAIYATLDRLEAKGYVTSRLGEPTAERGGRSKRFFRVTAKGVSAVNRTRRALLSISEGLRLVGRYS
jgi:DNA-binding PadR family transcriptional regulator